ncbi:MAG: flavodoxin [Lachnospiraceae bacterium]|nr:flavodoxin [Lachnospiraceae bacterium]
MIKVVYWTGSGNTQAMAEAVLKGIQDAGKEAELVFIDDTTPADVAGDAVIAFGCPAMGAEVLEEGSVEPFMADYETTCNGKKIALFGSYGWGDGQWMRDWEERLKSNGATIINGEGLIINDAPDADGVAQCEALGKAIAEA